MFRPLKNPIGLNLAKKPYNATPPPWRIWKNIYPWSGSVSAHHQSIGEWNLIRSGVIRTQRFTTERIQIVQPCPVSCMWWLLISRDGWSVAAMQCNGAASKNNPKHKQWFLVAKNLFPIIRIITVGGWLYIWMALPTTGWRFIVRMNLIFEHMIH